MLAQALLPSKFDRDVGNENVCPFAVTWFAEVHRSTVIPAVFFMIMRVHHHTIQFHIWILNSGTHFVLETQHVVQQFGMPLKRL